MSAFLLSSYVFSSSSQPELRRRQVYWCASAMILREPLPYQEPQEILRRPRPLFVAHPRYKYPIFCFPAFSTGSPTTPYGTLGPVAGTNPASASIQMRAQQSAEIFTTAIPQTHLPLIGYLESLADVPQVVESEPTGLQPLGRLADWSFWNDHAEQETFAAAKAN